MFEICGAARDVFEICGAARYIQDLGAPGGHF
jgi:hypothetical protein